MSHKRYWLYKPKPKANIMYPYNNRLLTFFLFLSSSKKKLCIKKGKYGGDIDSIFNNITFLDIFPKKKKLSFHQPCYLY